MWRPSSRIIYPNAALTEKKRMKTVVCQSIKQPSQDCNNTGFAAYTSSTLRTWDNCTLSLSQSLPLFP
jgi:hypothetical protein